MKFAAIALLPTLMLGLVACGGGSDSTNTDFHNRQLAVELVTLGKDIRNMTAEDQSCYTVAAIRPKFDRADEILVEFKSMKPSELPGELTPDTVADAQRNFDRAEDQLEDFESLCG